MENKKQEKVTSNLQFSEDKLSDEYKFLFHKLKSIRQIINLLEKKFFR